MSDPFHTITSEDWRRSIAAARSSENLVLKAIREKCPTMNNPPFPRFTPERRYVNRSGSLSDPDMPDDIEEQLEREEQRQHDMGEDDYHRHLDADAIVRGGN